MERLDDEGHVGDFSASFPAALRSDVAAVAATVPESRLAPAAPFVVCVDEELVSIPFRIYNAELSHDTQQRLSPAQRTVMACMYTRHHDGYVRQRHLEAIVGQAETWVAPFVVQLLGEYVVQIVLAVRCGLADIDVPVPRYIALTDVRGNQSRLPQPDVSTRGQLLELLLQKSVRRPAYLSQVPDPGFDSRRRR